MATSHPARTSRSWPLTYTWACALCALVACVPPLSEDEERTRWIQSTLIEDNIVYLERVPDRVAEKWAKMGSSQYAWFRGNLGQFLRDHTPHSAHAVPTAFGTGPGSTLLVLGDPHLENIGTFRTASGEMAIEFNDFDTASFGLWILDVRRFALSLWLLERSLFAEPLGLVSSFTHTYAETVLNPDAPATPVGDVLDDLIKRARRDGDSHEKRTEYTHITGKNRTFRIGDLEPPTSSPWGIRYPNNTLLSPSPEERRWVVRLLTRAAPNRPPIAAQASEIKDVAIRLGAGVGSYPVLRYYALLEGPTEDPNDDTILEIKEIPPAPARPFQDLIPLDPWTSNAERVTDAQRTLQATPQQDPLLAWTVDAPISFKARHRTAYQKNLRTQRLIDHFSEGKLSQEDLQHLARSCGRLLAHTHLRSHTPDLSPARVVLQRALQTQTDLFTDETLSFVALYGPVMMHDFALLGEALRTHGPLLQYTPTTGRSPLLP